MWPKIGRGALVAILLLPIAAIVVCLVAGLVDGLGPWVLVVLAALLAGVGLLKWLEVRAKRAERQREPAAHDAYSAAMDLVAAGDLTGAADRFEEAARLDDSGVYAMDIVEELAAVRVAQGDPGRAAAVWRDAHAAGPTVATANGLAAMLLLGGDREAAAELYATALRLSRPQFGDWHPESVAARNGVARTVTPPAHAETAEVYARELGPGHPDTLAATRQAAPEDRATVCLAAGDLAGARTLREAAVEDLLRRHGEADLRTASAVSDLAMVLREVRDLTASYRAYERAGWICARVPGGPHAEALVAEDGIARVMLLRDDWTNASAALTSVLAGCVTRYGDNDPRTLAARKNLQVVDGIANGARPGVADLRRAR